MKPMSLDEIMLKSFVIVVWFVGTIFGVVLLIERCG